MRKVAKFLATAALLGTLVDTRIVVAAPTQGASEVQVSGGFFHSEDSDEGSLNVDLSYGYYLTPGWQVGVRQALNYNFIDDRRDFWIATTSPFLITTFA